jgi:hypothetical protein
MKPKILLTLLYWNLFYLDPLFLANGALYLVLTQKKKKKKKNYGCQLDIIRVCIFMFFVCLYFPSWIHMMYMLQLEGEC